MFFLCGFISNVRGDSEESENKLYNNYKSVPHREKRNEQQNTHTQQEIRELIPRIISSVSHDARDRFAK